jgi:hypothetical protein
MSLAATRLLEHLSGISLHCFRPQFVAVGPSKHELAIGQTTACQVDPEFRQENRSCDADSRFAPGEWEGDPEKGEGPNYSRAKCVVLPKFINPRLLNIHFIEQH